METKKCPKCGAEIPVEMSFCLHCMERTDGVLEIKKKAAPNRKLTAAVIIIFVLMTAVTILLIWQFIGRDDSEKNISSSTSVSDAPQKTSDISESETVNDNNNNNSTSNFEELFTERLNGWGASHVLTDTLSFSENGCTFTSNVGTDKVNCTVTANAEMTDFTLIIEPATEYTSYATAVYIPDIVNEITYFVLDYRMSSSMRTEIGLMFENFESDGSFAENELHCDISTQAHNGGSYPITINCRID